MKQNAPKTHIMEMAVSERYQVKQYTLFFTNVYHEKDFIRHTCIITSRGYFLIIASNPVNTSFHYTFRPKNTNKLVLSIYMVPLYLQTPEDLKVVV